MKSKLPGEQTLHAKQISQLNTGANQLALISKIHNSNVPTDTRNTDLNPLFFALE